MKRTMALAALLITLVVQPGPSGASKPKVTGLFTNMQYYSDTGDVGGTEVFIVYSTDGIEGRYYATVQEAGGVPRPPVLVPVDVEADKVKFTIPGPVGKPVTFQGRVTTDALVGSFEGNAEQLTLPRRNSYWQ